MRTKLLEVIAMTYAYYNPGQSLLNQIVSMYADDLGDLPADQCIQAYGTYRRNPRNTRFPLPAAIRELVRPGDNISAEAQAREIAARISGAIPKYGWCNSSEARRHIGEMGWGVVERQGGWQYLCENHGVNINPTSFQAQVRDQVLSNIQYGPSALEAKIHALPSASGDMVQIGDLVKRLTTGVKLIPARDKKNESGI